MKRFVSYLYSVYNNQKIHNAGFARMELRTGRNRVEIHLKENGYSGKTGTVYLFIRKQENIQGISIGNITFRNNQADFRYEQPDDRIGQTPWQIMQMNGILIIMDERVAFLSQWDEQPVDTAKFRIWNDKQADISVGRQPDLSQNEDQSQQSIPKKESSSQQSVPQKEARLRQSIQQKEGRLQPGINQTDSQHQNTEQKSGQQHLVTAPKETQQRLNTAPKEMQQHPNTAPKEMQQHPNTAPKEIQQHPNTAPKEIQQHPNKSSKQKQQHSYIPPEEMQQYQDIATKEMQQYPNGTQQDQSNQKIHQKENHQQNTQQTTNQQEQHTNLNKDQKNQNTTREGNQQSQKTDYTQQINQEYEHLSQNQNQQEQNTDTDHIRNPVKTMQQSSRNLVMAGSESMNAESPMPEPEGQSQNAGSGPDQEAAARQVSSAGASDLRTAELQPQPKNQWEQTWRYMLRTYPVLNQFSEENQVLCVRIEIKDVRLLPAKYWSMVNNSFLLHGFFNYRYLAFGRIGQNWFVGIPGIYQNQEHVMASIFGFPDFLPQKQKTERGEQPGYWYRILEI